MISRRRFVGTLGGSALLPGVALSTEPPLPDPASRSRQGANLESGGQAHPATPEPVAAKDVGALPAWSPPATAPTEGFRFDASPEKLQGGHWRVPGLPRRYFQEFLPATFERTLVIDQLEFKQGSLGWIFTGEFGGFTITASDKGIYVFQRYYDSFGLGDLVKPKRHPERITAESTATFQGNLRAITVRLDSRLSLSVLLNGKEAIRQSCLLDVRRHQLAWEGSEGAAAGYLLAPETTGASIDVNPSQIHQTMLGFGGITTPTAYGQLSDEGKRRWWKLLAEYNLLLQREYPLGARLNAEMDNWDHLQDAMPHYYSDNFPNGEVSDFTYLRNIRRMGGKVLFEFWALPPWALQNWTDAQGKAHDGVADPEQYAHAMVRYCQVSRDRVGAPPDIVGIENELPQPPEIWHQMTLRLRAELDKAGFSGVKIHMRDDGILASGIECARAFQQSSAAWKDIDYVATHLYDYQKCLHDPDDYDPLLAQWRDAVGTKPFLSTEICINNSGFQDRSYRLALGMGQLYHKNLTLANASAIIYCWLLLNVEQPSFGWTRALFVPDPARGFLPVTSSYQARVFGAYSRRIRAGMMRVEAQASNPDLLATAFVGNNGARTLVLLNRSLTPHRVRIKWDGKPFRFLEWASPYEENTELPAPAGDELVVPPGALATLSTEELGRLEFAPEGVRA
ncbi:MAG: glycoside hydrolase family 30 beta sandwich domain-containing protein [Terriglobia bacterium]